ncbi:hypothetical protein BDY24DRAFT_412961 [Mrakia frigida]|uniref:uncharacterized protein n=1 Tax=Mrakia frigida TaxID=29902 RepID=UPI003FCC14B2
MEPFREKDTADLQEYIANFDPDAQDGKVTWVNVKGLNWIALKAIAIKFELHPLALEDALNYTRLSNSKAEWYPDALFVRLLTHELVDHLQEKGLKADLHLVVVVSLVGMNFSVFPDIGVFGEGGTPRGPNPTGDIASFWKIAAPLVSVVTVVLILTQFGDRFLNLGLRTINTQQRREAARRRDRR